MFYITLFSKAREDWRNQSLKQELSARNEATELFGREREGGLDSILNNIEQTFAGECLYKTPEEKAAQYFAKEAQDTHIRQWVLSLPFDLGFLLANNPEVLSDVLKVIHRAISSFLIKKAGLTVKTGVVTLIQRFGSALNLNIHFHMLFLDGA